MPLVTNDLGGKEIHAAKVVERPDFPKRSFPVAAAGQSIAGEEDEHSEKHDGNAEIGYRIEMPLPGGDRTEEPETKNEDHHHFHRVEDERADAGGIVQVEIEWDFLRNDVLDSEDLELLQQQGHAQHDVNTQFEVPCQ